MKKVFRYFIAIAWIATGLLSAPDARAEDSKEYLVKAAFIYNFVKFVEWPGDKAISKLSNIDICVIGDSPLSQTQAVFKQATTPQLALTLVNERNIANVASHCHIAFIGTSEQGRIGDIINALKGQPVLLVSDIDNFAENGGMIGFTMQDNKVKLTVNTKSTAVSGMRIDAQLLEIALKVIR